VHKTASRVLKTLNRSLDHLEERLIVTLMAGATALIFFAVLHRYGTGVSIDLAKWSEAHGVPVLPRLLRGIYVSLAGLDVSWAQELCIYMFIWMAKFGAAYGVRTGIHVGVDVLVNLLPPASRKRVILFALLCGAFFTAAIATFGVTFVGEMFKTGQQSNDLEWPMWFIYSAIPLGSGLMCFRFLQVSWWYYWTGELPHHSEAKVEGVEATDALHPSTELHGTVSSRWASPFALALILSPLLILAICAASRDHDLHPTDRVHGHRHAGFDCARLDRADLPVRPQRRTDRVGIDEAVHGPG
jgi:C4-dicarboxylate transporter, DctM subunit